MSSSPAKSSQPSRPQHVAVAPSNQTILLDKLNARRSTPDSEALASSDDEADPHRQEHIQLPAQPQKPVRRASWLNDTSQVIGHPRKGSFASSSMSPTTSHPTTPSADMGSGTWGPHTASTSALNRGHPGTGSFPWSTGIWNTERKEPPSRFTEVLPSPAAHGNPAFPEGALSQTSPPPREQPSNSQLPFTIPLHPTPKTYRSQSYSVGQLDRDAVTTSLGSSAAVGSRRPIPHSGLQHRPPRPSMLSEMASDGSMLGKVNEDEDDEDSSGSMHGSQTLSADSHAIEILARENAMLRQQQYQNARMKSRASTSAAYGLGNGYFQESVPEESDYAVDELDENNDLCEPVSRRNLARRGSEYGAGMLRTPYPPENRKLENVRRAYWQSSLPFYGPSDIPQSRRHSFADIPPRQGSIISIGGESIAPHEQGVPDSHLAQDFPSPYSENVNFPTANTGVSSYFQGVANAAGLQQAPTQPTAYGGQYPSPYAPFHPPYANRPASPHRGMYGLTQPLQNQPLHIVLFKGFRADVFYIQEGTGLTVRPGDLVIVEADRGTDLGTVDRVDVDWKTAKELKEHFAEEHYKWLVMYSQLAGAVQGAGTVPSGMQGSAVGGMGPPNPHHMQEAGSGELKPKLIKRLAQSHEITALRDKEGNEAKAKRVCMQKVKEHGLNMEILDAEFQVDWKKLTFYYFADTYINFNALVTDLFKIYKTRIWMSAINPASFASPLGLQAPSGIGPGAVGVGRGSNIADRRQNAASSAEQQTAIFSSSARAVRPSNSQPSFNDSAGAVGSNYMPSGYSLNPLNPYGSAFGSSSRPNNLSYGLGLGQLSPDQPQAGFPPRSEYHIGRARLPSPPSADAQNEQGTSPLSHQAEWEAAFQGLSLNSR